MALDLTGFEAILEKGLEIAQEAAPFAALGGPAAAAIGETIGSLAGLAEKVLPQLEADATIIASGDTTKIKALQAQLQAENASFAQQIAAS
jgi:hypothetical protein